MIRLGPMNILSIALRIGELVFSSTVAGITGTHLADTSTSSLWSRRRFVFVEAVAGLGVLCSILFLLPFVSPLVAALVDIWLFVLFLIAFGLVVSVSLVLRNSLFVFLVLCDQTS